MTFDQLVRTSGEWMLGVGPASPVVFSTRIRLARNLAERRFLSRCEPEEKERICRDIRDAVVGLDWPESLAYFDVSEMTPLDRQVLVERHLISRQHADGEGPRGVAVAAQEQLALMVNEEDHLRTQVLRGGLRIEETWEQMARAEALLEERLEFAFHPRFGYLTACPTNVGTGLRVSVMLHLPGLKMTKEIEKLFHAAKDMKLAVRGLYGEGTQAAGDFFQISNQITLGRSERDLLGDFRDRVVPAVVDYELAARDALLKHTAAELDDRVFRALGVLRHARSISSQEALSLLSQVRLGIHMSRIPDSPPDLVGLINEMLFRTQPAHIQQSAGRELTPPERREFRARYIRERLNGHAHPSSAPATSPGDAEE